MGMKIENFRHLPDSEKWDYVEKVLDSLLTDVTAVNAELTKTNTDLDAANAELTKTNTDLDAVAAELTKTNTDLDAVAAELTKTNTDLDQHQTAALTENTAIDALNRWIKYLCLSPAGLTLGSVDPTLVKITNTVVFTNAGVFKSKATAEFAFTATDHDIADGSFACFLVSLQADGTPVLTKGADAASAVLAIAAMPACPAGETPIGYFTLGASGAIFNATTDSLSDAHLTDVYYDMSVVPELLGADPTAVSATTMDAAAVTMDAAAVTMAAASVTMDAATLTTSKN